MDENKRKEFEELVEWLFERAPADWFAQTGYAGGDKKGFAWFPGRHPQCATIAGAQARGTFGGCTQLAFQFPGTNPWLFTDTTPCYVTWVGIDVDEPGTTLPPMPGWSVRTSRSGNGFHLIQRLATPALTTAGSAGVVVKAIAGAGADRLREFGVPVCKADRRMFWMVGGRNAWISRTDEFVDAPIPDLQVALRAPRCLSGPAPVGPSVNKWCGRLREGGFPGFVGNHRIYIGSLVPWLRSQGLRVETKSRMRGNGEPNGYLEITNDRISLWSFADGHTIWEWNEL